MNRLVARSSRPRSPLHTAGSARARHGWQSHSVDYSRSVGYNQGRGRHRQDILEIVVGTREGAWSHARRVMLCREWPRSGEPVLGFDGRSSAGLTRIVTIGSGMVPEDVERLSAARAVTVEACLLHLS